MELVACTDAPESIENINDILLFITKILKI